jgi:hypothetical protein
MKHGHENYTELLERVLTDARNNSGKPVTEPTFITFASDEERTLYLKRNINAAKRFGKKGNFEIAYIVKGEPYVPGYSFEYNAESGEVTLFGELVYLHTDTPLYLKDYQQGDKDKELTDEELESLSDKQAHDYHEKRRVTDMLSELHRRPLTESQLQARVDRAEYVEYLAALEAGEKDDSLSP